jgi:hypothetical protein
MKKGLFLLVFSGVYACAGSLDWMLPAFTLKYEITGGTIEDPDPDEDIMIPSSLRNTVSLAIRESADPLSLGLLIRYSAKDYLVQAGDYSYLSLDPEARMKLGDAFDLGLSAGMKWAASPELDSSGLSKDYLALEGSVDAGWKPVKGTALDLSVSTEYDLYKAAEKARQIYSAGAGLSSRLGGMLLSVRYRGVFRLPLGSAGSSEASSLNTGSVSIQWDPNR